MRSWRSERPAGTVWSESPLCVVKREAVPAHPPWAFEQVHSSSKAASSRLFSASKSLNSNGQQLKTNRVLGQMFLSDLAAMPRHGQHHLKQLPTESRISSLLLRWF